MAQPVLVYTRIEANRRNTRLLLALFSLLLLPVVLALAAPLLPMVLLGLGLLVDVLLGGDGGGPLMAINYVLLLIVVLKGAISLVRSVTLRFGSRMILRIARATPLGPGEEPGLVRTVENLCIAAGLPVPGIYSIESPVPNAFATGRDPEHASLVVTRGLLNLLEQRELEGVIAHELSHIGNHDILLTTTLAALVSIAVLPFSMSAAIYTAASEGEIKFSSESVVLLLAMLAGMGFFMLAGLHGAGAWWWAPAYLLFVSPVGALVVRTAVSRQREFLADADAVLLTRDPEGLALALVKIAAARGHRLRVGEGSVHLYIADPYAEDDSLIHRMFPTHPPVERRIALLAQMGSGFALEDLQRAREAGITAAETAATSIGVEMPSYAPHGEEVIAGTDGAALEPNDQSGRDDPAGDSLTPLYEQPDGWSRVLQRLPADAVVQPAGREGAFIRVLTNDGVTGYVSRLAPLAVVKAWSISNPSTPK